MAKVQALNFKPRLSNIDRILQDLVFSLDHIKQNMDELYKYHPNNPHQKDVVSDYQKMRDLYFQTEMEIDHYSTVYNILEKEANIILN